MMLITWKAIAWLRLSRAGSSPSSSLSSFSSLQEKRCKNYKNNTAYYTMSYNTKYKILTHAQVVEPFSSFSFPSSSEVLSHPACFWGMRSSDGLYPVM